MSVEASSRVADVAALDAVQRLIEEREPRLEALVEEANRFGRLREEMRQLEGLFPDRVSRPPLFGLLVGVKDIFHVGGLATRAGSRLPSDELAGEEAESVRRLKEAGALVLGKTRTTEFAYFAPASTRNPRHPEHTPGGSSSGSAAAVAAGYCALALGTQTIGSISRPASFCGVVGFKPSYDRISRRGVIPLAPSLDHVGLFAPSVATAAAAAPRLCDDWRVVDTSEPPTLGIPDGPYLERAEEPGRALFERAAENLASSGLRIERVRTLADFERVEERHQLILAAEAARVHARWYALYGERYHAKTAALLERGQSITDGALLEARGGRLALRSELESAMQKSGIDLWLSPAAPGVAPRGLGWTGDPVMNLPWTQAGLPTLALPAIADAEGLPFGLQLAAPFGGDEALLAWAAEIESRLGWGGSR